MIVQQSPADPLSEVLALLRPRSFGFRGVDGGGDWALRFAPAGGLKVFAVRAGACRLILEEDGAACDLGPGDLVLLPGRTAFRLASSDGAPPQDAYGLLGAAPAGGVMTMNGGGDAFGVGGFFDFDGVQADMLLGVLPAVLFFPAAEARSTLGLLIDRLMAELRTPRPGGALIASHLAQTLLIEALRLHLDGGAEGARGWLAALGDAQLRKALTAMHAEPAHAWTLDALGRTSGMSRSAFAARFTAIVGEPALRYLTRWRMMLAADRLARGGATLATVAPGVGYESESAFGVAFKRIIGRSPRAYSQEVARGGGAAPRRGGP